MSDPVISVESLSKSYLIGHQGPRERYTSLRDSLASGTKSMLRKTRDLATGKQSVQGDSVEEFWALKDVSFEVKQGEVLGIIGRNGAGKSTLLKVLSRITEPTSGRVALTGRVASLLEVGTGFHPELTGRENLYLNGAILGMSRKEITRKFDEIVAFAGVEKFLDTPVKRYSSGMYVRLAFAVAAHLEPEILIVDEVLAVGDAEFQKKCMGKIKDVAGQGRTVIFVSHDISAISALTKKCILLRNGQIQFQGETSEALKLYRNSDAQSSTYIREKSLITDIPHISKVSISSGDTGGHLHHSADKFSVTIEIAHADPLVDACLSFQIVNQFAQPVIHCWIFDQDKPICRKKGPSTLKCILPKLSLNAGSYSITCYLSEPPGRQVFETLEGVCCFNVEVVGKHRLWGWQPNAFAYFEDFHWNT